MRIKNPPRATCPWALDSGGFSELSLYGKWTVEPEQYAAEVHRWREIGGLEWAACQDWMCEPWILKKTGLSVQEHQRRTITNFLRLRELAPDLPWTPVLQGWGIGDYLQHIRAWEVAGVSLHSVPVVGVGSVCRRQATGLAEDLIKELHATGLRLHGFGFKVLGLRRVAHYLTSADSLAWSFQARYDPIQLGGCNHKNCANCLLWAEKWYKRLMGGLDEVLSSGPLRPTG